jgi:hypothetical protein
MAATQQVEILLSVNCGLSRKIIVKIIKISKNKFQVDLQECKFFYSKFMEKLPELRH